MKFQVSEVRQLKEVEKEEFLPAQLLGDIFPKFIRVVDGLHIQALAKISQTDIIVSGKIKTKFVMDCARCLEGFQRPFSVEFKQIFSLDSKEIDLSDEVRENILIDLPLKPLCNDECQGLCPVCGQNKNITACSCLMSNDARWEVLKQYPFK
jgi:uncharacterized protein